MTKGEYEFDNETLRMFSVMFAHKFRDLKQLEKTWIGSLNKEGSQAIKWSFIEYILAETARSCITSVSCAVSMACARILTLTSRDAPWKRPTGCMNG